MCVKATAAFRHGLLSVLLSLALLTLGSPSSTGAGRSIETLPNSTNIARESESRVPDPPPATAGAEEGGSSISESMTATPEAPQSAPTVRPHISSVTPKSGGTNGGTRVAIRGTALRQVTRVTIAGAPAGNLTRVSNTLLTVTTPRHSPGVFNVIAISSSGSSVVSSATKFTYVAAPTESPKVTGVAPASVKRDVETGVVITGENFLNVDRVQLGAADAKSFRVISPTKIEIVTPKVGWRGSSDVRVVTRAGTSATSPSAKLTFHDPHLVAGGFTLDEGESLTSRNAAYRLILQTDGNLVLYRVGGAALWATDVFGEDHRAVMQTDGNFVVYAGSRAVWSSTTAGYPGSVLALQDDGNLVIYVNGWAVWSKDRLLYDTLHPNASMSNGQSRMSPNHEYRLFMQSDGNLVLYRGDTAVWATGTSGSGHRLVMQGDGNLVLYRGAASVLWATGTEGNPGAYLRVQSDGNLVIYRDGRPVWSRYNGHEADVRLTWSAGATWNVTNGQHATRAWDFQPPGAGSHNDVVLAASSGTARLTCQDAAGQAIVSLSTRLGTFRYIHLQTSAVASAGITTAGVPVTRGQPLGRLHPNPPGYNTGCGYSSPAGASHLHFEFPAVPFSVQGITFSSSGPTSGGLTSNNS